MADEAPTLQQYSKQLNVYDSTDTHRGRLSINAADLFEISYKAGLSAVLVKNLCYQDGNEDTPHNVSGEFYMINRRVDLETVRATAAEGVLTSAVESERTRAMTEEKKSSDGLASEISSRTSAVGSIATDLAVEAAARISDVVSLQQMNRQPAAPPMRFTQAPSRYQASILDSRPSGQTTRKNAS